MASLPIVLVADDDSISRRLIEHNLRDSTESIYTAQDGDEAWEMLKTAPEAFDVVILDWLMPERDGIEVLRLMKSHEELQNIPVVFQTTKTDEKDIMYGLKEGVSFYLSKPCERKNLQSVVKTAFENYKSYKKIQEGVNDTEDVISMMHRGNFHFKTIEEGTKLATMLAKTTPTPKKAVLGLWELFFNAVEHGNLGITYNEKTKLNESNTWKGEVKRRLNLEENKVKYVEIDFERKSDEIVFHIKDQGKGFDYNKYLDLSTERAFHSHGRGISMARMMSFSKVEYQGNGNEVIATISLDQ
ncbi:MAG: response regulator [Desulfobacterales bacterium]|nr:response regulator [Desulfobacterales bacterium]MCP4163918.1 response regulator [Deltaproteobacteria bacterium]